MNDLDLRTALHRDAELVGAPSPDLLDQLVQRRQHQRRQLAGMLTTVLAVVVIAAGIPVGTSLLARSDGGPAGESVVEPTPSVSPEVSPPTARVTPTPTPVPTPEVTPLAAPETNVAAPSATPVEDVTPSCPDLATLDGALPPDTATDEYTIFAAGDQVCSGVWVAAGFSWSHLYDGEWVPDGEAGLFRYVDGSWTFSFRDVYCGDAAALPAVIWERACNVD